MPSPSALYPLVLDWLKAMAYPAHRTVRRALARRTAALLVAQHLTPAALMRALPSAQPVPARTRYAAVADFWDTPALTAAQLTPVLVPAALGLARVRGQPHLALDTVRCGAWETFTLGLVWHGRVVPLSWAVVPYPMPKGVFTPTTCALIRQVAAVWPRGAGRPHLVADRGFPSAKLFRTLAAVDWDFTIRLRASGWVSVADQRTRLRALPTADRDGTWSVQPATFASGPRAVTARLVVGRGVGVVPWHQRDGGSARHRARQRGQRQHDLTHKHPRQAADASGETDTWMVLFTTHATWLAALRSYRRRWATEGSYRDAQSGWDGQHGWGLEVAVRRLRQAAAVQGVFGLWALGTLLQTWVGDQVLHAAPAAVGAVARQWTTSGRLSVWAAGQLALTDPHGGLTAWLQDTLAAGVARLAAPLVAARVPGADALPDPLAA